MAAEFAVEQSKSTETRRPDIVLFVNGIPLVVIENKKASALVSEELAKPFAIKNRRISQTYIFMPDLAELEQKRKPLCNNRDASETLEYLARERNKRSDYS